MQQPAQEAETLPQVAVLAWLFPLANLLRRSGRRSWLTWDLVLLDLVLVATIVVASFEHREDPAWIGHLGREPVAALGLEVEPREQALIVVGVLPDSSGREAGVQLGDAIVTIDDELVFDAAMVNRRIEPRPIGTTFRLLVRRDARNHMLEVQSIARWQTTTSAIARVALHRLVTALVVVLTLAGVAIVMWRRKAPWPWAPFVVLGLLLGQALLGGQVDPLVSSLCVAVSASLFVRRIRSDRAPALDTLRTTVGTTLALPVLALRGFFVGLLVAYALGIPFPNMGAAAVTWSTGLAIVVGVPVMEELVFRGLLLPTMARAMRPWTALCVTSLLFGGLHCFGPTNPGAATAYGFALGYLRLRTGRVVPCILVHAAINGVALALGMA